MRGRKSRDAETPETPPQAAADRATPKTRKAAAPAAKTRDPAKPSSRSKAGALSKALEATSPSYSEAPPLPVPHSSDALNPRHESVDADAAIRARAYELYLTRGGTEGGAMADWLEAEQQVRGRSNGDR